MIQEEHRAQLERMQQKLTETENNLTRLQQEKQQQPQQSRVVRSRSPPDLTLPRGTEERRPAEVGKPWCPPDIVVVLKLQRACSNVTWRSATGQDLLHTVVDSNPGGFAIFESSLLFFPVLVSSQGSPFFPLNRKIIVVENPVRSEMVW